MSGAEARYPRRSVKSSIEAHDPCRSDAFHDCQMNGIAYPVDGEYPAAYHGVSWDGTDEQRRAVSSGVYFYQLKTPAFQQTARMTLVR